MGFRPRLPFDETPVYVLILSTSAALVAAFGVFQLDAGWFLAILAGLVVFVVSQLLVGRRMRKRLEPAMAQVRRQVEAGALPQALDTLRGLLDLGPWIPLLRAQLYAQMGVLAHHLGKKEEALEHLGKASRRSPEAQLLLASLHDRAGRKDDAKKVLDRAAPFQRKNALFANVHAFVLDRHGDTRGAMAVLNKLIQKSGDDASRDNLRRLENGKKLNMKAFGFPWYALGYEQPPASMGRMQTGRKGFRTPPKSQR